MVSRTLPVWRLHRVGKATRVVWGTAPSPRIFWHWQYRSVYVAVSLCANTLSLGAMTQYAGEVKLFGKWSFEDVEVKDMSLEDYIACKPKSLASVVGPVL